MISPPSDASARHYEESLELAERVPEPNASGIVYKIASNREEREAAFRLVHRAYTQTGLIEANPYGMRVTPYHLLDTTAVFIAVYQRDVICTLSLIGDGDLGMPMASIYADEVTQLRDQGLYVGEVSCLADRRRELTRIMPVFVKLAKVMAQYARLQGMNNLLIAVHPRHTRFYKRFMAFDEFGELKTYPTVRNNPAIACNLDFAKADRERPPCYEQFFGDPLPVEELRACPMTAAEREYFAPAARFGQAIVPVAIE